MEGYFWSQETGAIGGYCDLEDYFNPDEINLFNFEDNFYNKSPNTPFHIGDFSEDKPAQLLKCKKCQSDKFFVGRHTLFTAIKCPNCGWELCIHEG